MQTLYARISFKSQKISLYPTWSQNFRIQYFSEEGFPRKYGLQIFRSFMGNPLKLCKRREEKYDNKS